MLGKCSKCEALQSEVSFLREEIKRMNDRLMALADARAYEAVSFKGSSSEYYGTSDDDEEIVYGPYGEKMTRPVNREGH